MSKVIFTVFNVSCTLGMILTFISLLTVAIILWASYNYSLTSLFSGFVVLFDGFNRFLTLLMINKGCPWLLLFGKKSTASIFATYNIIKFEILNLFVSCDNTLSIATLLGVISIICYNAFVPVMAFVYMLSCIFVVGTTTIFCWTVCLNLILNVKNKIYFNFFKK